jgi:hypothetical protein
VSNETCALTHQGYVDIEAGIPLQELRVGNIVLGLQNPDDPEEPRCEHVVTAAFGKHFVPTEDPTTVEKFLRFVGLEKVYAGDKREGILVGASLGDPEDGAALFDVEATPVLDRVIF